MTGQAPNQTYSLPATGTLRLWRKNGYQPRNGKTVANGGDYIESGTAYRPSQLGFGSDNGGKAVLYVEPVGSATLTGSPRNETIYVQTAIGTTGVQDLVSNNKVVIPAPGSAVMTVIDAQFQLIHDSDVTKGWDSPKSSSDGNAWTPVITGKTNSLVKLSLPSLATNPGLECVVNDQDGSSNYISLKAVTLQGGENDLVITGTKATPSSTNSTTNIFTPSPADIVFRVASTKEVLKKLNVLVFDPVTTRVDVFYATDNSTPARKNITALSQGVLSTDAIIQSLNSTYGPQAGITFTLHTTGNLNVPGGFDAGGNTDWNSSVPGLNIDPSDANTGAIIAAGNQLDASDVPVLYVVKNLKDINTSSTKDKGADAVGLNWNTFSFVDSNQIGLVYGHETGHEVNISVSNITTGHDIGPFPSELTPNGSQPQHGLMWPSTDGQASWMRHEDWQQAHDYAKANP